MPDNIEYAGVKISANAVWQSEAGRVVDKAVRAEIVACELRYGSPEPRPFVSLCLGTALTVPGVIGVEHFLAQSFTPVSLRFEGAMLVFGGIGVWLVLQSLLRRRFYLEVSTRNRRTKLVFASTATSDGARKFIKDAQQQFAFDAEDRSPQSVSRPQKQGARLP